MGAGIAGTAQVSASSPNFAPRKNAVRPRAATRLGVLDRREFRKQSISQTAIRVFYETRRTHQAHKLNPSVELTSGTEKEGLQHDDAVSTLDNLREARRERAGARASHVQRGRGGQLDTVSLLGRETRPYPGAGSATGKGPRIRCPLRWARGFGQTTPGITTGAANATGEGSRIQ